MWLWLAAAVAGPQEDVREVERCLDLQDVACAASVVQRAGMETAADPILRVVAADVAFSRGDYPKAFDLMASCTSERCTRRRAGLKLCKGGTGSGTSLERTPSW
jgi:hypothetical protein